MNHCDKFFRFPVKLFLTKDIEDSKNREEILGIKLEEPEEPDYVTGWDCVDVNDIRGFGTIFSRNRSIEDVKADGFDSTIIYLSYGREVGCAWSPDKFKEKLNTFVERMEEEKKRQKEKELIEQADTITRQIEVNLSHAVYEPVEEPRKDSILQRFIKWIKSF